MTKLTFIRMEEVPGIGLVGCREDGENGENVENGETDEDEENDTTVDVPGWDVLGILRTSRSDGNELDELAFDVTSRDDVDDDDEDEESTRLNDVSNVYRIVPNLL